MTQHKHIVHPLRWAMIEVTSASTDESVLADFHAWQAREAVEQKHMAESFIQSKPRPDAFAAHVAQHGEHVRKSYTLPVVRP